MIKYLSFYDQRENELIQKYEEVEYNKGYKLLCSIRKLGRFRELV